MREWKRVALECMLIGLVGGMLGLAANHFNYDRLTISRDYFHRMTIVAGPPAKPGALPESTSESTAGSNSAAQAEDDSVAVAQLEALKRRLHDHGIRMIDFEEVKALFESPGYPAGAYVFIDARDDRLYREGHLPGAFLVDHYRIERYIPLVLDYCWAADKIVVYCNGGECDDSEFVALDLLREGLDAGRIFVYAEGFLDWESHGMPVELGEQYSGVFQEASQ
ncbi:MAG: rhodanese-like domain-containing protein [Phycisphaerales bacterium]|nr:rhodanese-like domain-containing protein [Phycisphaerales bacterium]